LDNSGFSLDTLRVKEDEVREPAIYPVAVFLSRTTWGIHINDIQKFIQEVKKSLSQKFGFKKRNPNDIYREGLLDFECVGRNILECYYAKETAQKIEYVPAGDRDLELHAERLKTVNPPDKVKARIIVDKDGAEVILFGGYEYLLFRIASIVNLTLREQAKGSHETYNYRISAEEMLKILEAFGPDVESIYVDPGSNLKLKKVIIEKKLGQEYFERVYEVHTRFIGYRIVTSPIVYQIIREAGVYLREIQGKLDYAPGIKITTRISSSGRILFYIPGTILKEDASDLYDVALNLYQRVIAKNIVGIKQALLDKYTRET